MVGEEQRRESARACMTPKSPNCQVVRPQLPLSLGSPNPFFCGIVSCPSMGQSLSVPLSLTPSDGWDDLWVLKSFILFLGRGPGP